MFERLPLILAFFFVGCSSFVRSGLFVQMDEELTLKKVAKKYNVPIEKVILANKGKKFKKGDWIFVPQKIGILSAIMGERFNNANPDIPTLKWPVPFYQKLSAHFGEDRGDHIHQGIDIAAPKGVQFVAAQEGSVDFSGYDRGGYGNLVILSHPGGHKTYYAHASSLLVTQGQTVRKGDILGLVGSTGRSSGPHLHFEVKKEGESYDPLLFLNSL